MLPADIELMQLRVAESLWWKFTESRGAGAFTDDEEQVFLKVVAPFVAMQDMFVTSNEIRDSLRDIKGLLHLLGRMEGVTP
jgi:hypothetical protein